MISTTKKTKDVLDRDPQKRRASTLTIIAIAGLVLFLIDVLVTTLLRPEYNPLVHGLSYYAVGPRGWLMGAGLVSIALTGIAVALQHARAERQGRSTAGIILLITWGISQILAVIFPLDLPGSTPTLSGQIHGWMGMNFTLMLIAALLISRKLNKAAPNPRRMTAAVLITITSILLILFMGALQPLGLGGVFQRLYWLSVVVWLAMMIRA